VKEVIKNLSEYARKRSIAPLLLSLLWLCAIASLGFVWNLGNIGLVDETEPLFAEAARQMTVTGDFITPYFNGATRFDKPPLVYWLMAVAYRAIGVNEWAVRLSLGFIGDPPLLASDSIPYRSKKEVRQRIL
jgi:4-amino-4-deoxy-L-arabinose transferase and related glycosyltransferases of PMT family